ncbi:PepSY domain-containing protein [Thalassospira sp.]|uniref:PepSY domain-containing protein n=1 Tax=Thalassospira sp. TaxID=1912094 RepID=UPI003AA97B3B
MKTEIAVILGAGILILSGALPALAIEKDMCDVPMDQWQPREKLEQHLTAEGWEVQKITTDDGCYEVYATTEDGLTVEAYFNPETFDRVSPADD